MKTNKIYKLFTILLILVVTMFSFGCGKSQQEQFDKEFKETLKIATDLNNSLNKIENENIDAITMHKKIKKVVYEYDEKLNKQYEKLEKITKGNEKLEKTYKNFKKFHDENMIEYKYKINENEKILFQ